MCDTPSVSIALLCSTPDSYTRSLETHQKCSRSRTPVSKFSFSLAHPITMHSLSNCAQLSLPSTVQLKLFVSLGNQSLLGFITNKVLVSITSVLAKLTNMIRDCSKVESHSNAKQKLVKARSDH